MGTDTYSNSEKLIAVVNAWAKPMIAQLPMPYSLLAPALSPLLSNMLTKIPDDIIPSVINDVVDDMVSKGSVSIWKVTLDKKDLMSLQDLIRLNLPVERSRKEGYEVKTK